MTLEYKELPKTKFFRVRVEFEVIVEAQDENEAFSCLNVHPNSSTITDAESLHKKIIISHEDKEKCRNRYLKSA